MLKTVYVISREYEEQYFDDNCVTTRDIVCVTSNFETVKNYTSRDEYSYEEFDLET